MHNLSEVNLRSNLALLQKHYYIPPELMRQLVHNLYKLLLVKVRVKHAYLHKYLGIIHTYITSKLYLPALYVTLEPTLGFWFRGANNKRLKKSLSIFVLFSDLTKLGGLRPPQSPFSEDSVQYSKKYMNNILQRDLT